MSPLTTVCNWSHCHSTPQIWLAAKLCNAPKNASELFVRCFECRWAILLTLQQTKNFISSGSKTCKQSSLFLSATYGFTTQQHESNIYRELTRYRACRNTDLLKCLGRRLHVQDKKREIKFLTASLNATFIVGRETSISSYRKKTQDLKKEHTTWICRAGFSFLTMHCFGGSLK